MDGRQPLDSRIEIVYAKREKIADLFYAKLFDAMPEARPHLYPDFDKQKKMFALMVTMLGRSLTRNVGYEEYAEQLARAHHGLDIRAEQYRMGGAVLKAAMAEVLGTALVLRDRLALDRAVDRMIDTMSLRRLPG